MDKSEYFKLSNQLNLPKRCPILEKCSRRAWSIYLLGYFDIQTNKGIVAFLIDEGVLSDDFINNNIPVQGEFPTLSGGANNVYFHDVCPEVNLFDKKHAMFFAKDKACISGSWDKYNKDPKEKIIECRHFSECPEFSKYQFENKLLTKIDEINQIELIKDNIIRDKIGLALEMTKQISIQQNLSDAENACIILLSRFHDIQNKSIGGTESNDILRTEKNKIIEGILSLLNKIKDYSN